MSFALTDRMPIVRAVVRLSPVTLRYLESVYRSQLEPWPRSRPKELEIKALIDTGASVSILDENLVSQFEIEPKGYCSISGFDSTKSPDGKVNQYPNYDLGLKILGASDSEPILEIKIGQIVGHSIGNERFDAIIGMDVLAHCQFQLNGPRAQFELTAPVAVIEEMRSVAQPTP
jgi:hypothetical protein